MPNPTRGADSPSDGDHDPAEDLERPGDGGRAGRMAALGRSIAEIKAGQGIPVEVVLAEMRRLLAEDRTR